MYVEKLGNSLENLKSLYEEIQKDPNWVDRDRGVWWIPGEYNPKMASILCQPSYNQNILSSWAGLPKTFREWHFDPPGDPSKFIILASYPHPTQIMLETRDSLHVKVGYRLSLDSFTKYQELEDLISLGKITVIEPNPGDVYKISMDVVHRTNEKADPSVPHMCVRTCI